MNLLQEERLSTDVLVIGAGAGGMMAAICAAKKGAEVILCEKGNAKRSGGIRGGNDHFICYIPHIHGPVIREQLRHIAQGFGGASAGILNRIWDESYEVVTMWEDWGVQMTINGHYEFTGHAYPGSSGRTGEPGNTTRTYLHFSDNRLPRILEAQARASGVEIVNRIMITAFLKNDDGRIVGAVGLSTRGSKIYVIEAKAIVFNTGGIMATRMYASPIAYDYSLAEPETGDGDIAAYRVGAEIVGAETIHRHSAVVFGPFWGQGTWIGVVRDSEGKTIGPPFLTKPALELGDMSAANADAYDHLVATGRAPAWFDTRQLTEEDEAYMRFGFDSQAMQPFLKWMDEEGLDFRQTQFEMGIRQPAVLMRTHIDRSCRTAVQGLYSTLKNGLGSSATTGKIAGEEAAEYASLASDTSLAGNEGEIGGLKEHYEAILNRRGSNYAEWSEAQKALLQLMQWYVNPPLRTEHTLTAGHNQLVRVREKANRLLQAADNHDLCHCIEVKNLMDLAEIIIVAVRERRESRGESRRFDYPLVDPRFNDKTLLVFAEEGKPMVRWVSNR